METGPIHHTMVSSTSLHVIAVSLCSYFSLISYIKIETDGRMTVVSSRLPLSYTCTLYIKDFVLDLQRGSLQPAERAQHNKGTLAIAIMYMYSHIIQKGQRRFNTYTETEYMYVATPGFLHYAVIT